MKCKQGDTARIIYSLRPENIGRSVKVTEYIGKFEAGDMFEFRGMPCKAIVSDHYWWVDASDLATKIGPSPRAYIPDTWLEPVRKRPNAVKNTATQDLETII